MFKSSILASKNTIIEENIEEFCIMVRRNNKAILGGILCEIKNESLNINTLWLHESIRGKNISRKLIEESEIHARKNDCYFSRVSTASFQAPWLYLKLGYKKISEFKFGPHKTICYKKRLTN